MSALSYSRKPSRLHSLRRRARERERTVVGERQRQRQRQRREARGQGAAHEISVTWLLAIFSNIFWISARACFTCACASRRVRVTRECGRRAACVSAGRVSCLGARTVRLPLTVVKKFAFAALRATHVTLSRFNWPAMAAAVARYRGGACVVRLPLSKPV